MGFCGWPDANPVRRAAATHWTTGADLILAVDVDGE
jgi:hypothetical protein